MAQPTITLTAAEVATIGFALERGQFCTELLSGYGVIGTDTYIEKIKEALNILNRPFDDNRTEEEKDASALNDIYGQIDMWGAN